MVYVDTNVLIYITVNQGEEKRDIAARLIRKLIEDNELFLSPLTIQELIFTLAKLNIDLDQVTRDVNFYMDYIQHTIDKNILKDAYALCKEINFCRNINDGIHLKVAEQYCNKLVKFDKDFKKFLNRTTIEIEILKGS
jgi:predicted nucleic acid-binding protein